MKRKLDRMHYEIRCFFHLPVMANGPSYLMLEDRTIDVEGLLVEPQDGSLLMDSVTCFDGKILKNTMEIEDASCSSGGSDTGIAQKGKDILNREVLNAMPSEVDVEYYRLENGICSTDEEYLVGVQFAESITNLDYGSSEGLHTSSSDSQIQVPSDGPDSGCGPDDFPNCPDEHFNVGSSKFNDIPSRHECETSDGENLTASPRSSTSQTSGKSRYSSSSSSVDVLSVEMFSCPKTTKIGATNVIEGQEMVPTASVQAKSIDVLPTQKRSRKPTQRYIDGIAELIPAYKKRRELSSSTIKEKPLEVKDHRKCHVGPKAAIREPPEEFPIMAIQVPFGSLSHTERSESHKESPSKKKEDHVAAAMTKQKKRNDNTTLALIPKKRVDKLATDRLNMKGDDCCPLVHKKKRRNIGPTTESNKEVSAGRKHHMLWTISEVRSLIEGVSQFGVGRWSRIKKLFFSASSYRTSVDLKDKWRNLLKASGMHEQGDKKRNIAWRPLPKSILQRVCELATMHPYPNNERVKMALESSPERGTDKTDKMLSDYRRILRSIDGN